MADIKESPPLFDTNEAKIDDLDDDDEDIFASAVQVLFPLRPSYHLSKFICFRQQCSICSCYPGAMYLYRRCHCTCLKVR